MVRSEQDTASGRISFTQGPVDGSDLVLDDDHDDGDDNDDNYENDAHGNNYSIEGELEGIRGRPYKYMWSDILLCFLGCGIARFLSLRPASRSIRVASRSYRRLP